MPAKSTEKSGRKKKPSEKKIQSKLREAEAHISDVDHEVPYLKALIYAKNGKGKTYFGATGPDVIIIDCNEQGTPSIRHIPGVKVFRVSEWGDIELAYWYVKRGKHNRKTVVIDTLTSLGRMCMKYVLREEAEADPTRPPATPSQRDYGTLGELLSTQILNFRNLDMNVIFLAQERKSFQEDEDDEMEVGPSLPGKKAAEAVQDCVTIIGRLYTRTAVKKTKVKVKGKMKVKSKPITEHRLLLGDQDLYITKVNIQDHGLPKIMRDPTVPKMLGLINPGESKKKKKEAK